MRLADMGKTGRQEDVFRRPDRMAGTENAAQGGMCQTPGKEESEKVRLDISEAVQEMFQKQVEAGREAAENSGDALVDLGKVMEIARRIARGDQVPPRDEKKLMEYSDELYQMAKSTAMLNCLKKNKKHKSLYDDEEKNSLQEKIRKLSGEETGVREGCLAADAPSVPDDGGGCGTLYRRIM